MRALVLALLLAQTPAVGQTVRAPEHDLTVVNRSTRTINELYASPAESEDWGADQLADATIEPGQSARLHLGHGRECVFDLLAIYHDASREERHGVDICKTRSVTFDARQAAAPPAEDGTHTVVIDNQDNRPIQQVYLSGPEAGDWGDDRLGDASISVGESMALNYRGGCLADVRIVFDNRSAEERRGIDVCALGGVTVAPGWTTADVPAPPHPVEAHALEPLAVTVVNHAGRGASELYVFPENGARGQDVLGSAVLDDGAQVAVTLLRPHGLCRFVAHVVYGGKVPDQDLGPLDLCRSPTLVLPPRS